MDKSRYSRIAHGDLLVWNPVELSHLQSYVSQLELPENSAVLDIGCGRGHLLKLVLSQYKVRAIGVDSSPYATAQAAEDLAAFAAAGRLTLCEQAFEASSYDAASFDLVVCIGSTHAVDGYRKTLSAAKRLLRAGGLLLVGEGYWRQTPAADYLAFLEMTEEELSTHQDNQAAGRSDRYELVRCSECGQQEWDAYEDQYAHNIEQYVSSHPADPEAETMLQRIRAWRDAYLRRGRDTLGFGLYLFRAGRHSSSPPWPQ